MRKGREAAVKAMPEYFLSKGFSSCAKKICFTQCLQLPRCFLSCRQAYTKKLGGRLCVHGVSTHTRLYFKEAHVRLPFLLPMVAPVMIDIFLTWTN